MRFASLGSGSAGNAWLVAAGSTCILLDCGFGLRETQRRLARLGLQISDLQGILVTHEHSDHIGGVFKLARRHSLPVWLTHGTLMASKVPPEVLPCLQVIDAHSSFHIGDVAVHPYPVPHDAREPVQYVFSSAKRQLGVLTDAGHITPHMVRMLAECDALVLEANHDLDRLQRGPYPWFLKQRVAGPLGHLENGQSADLLTRLDCHRLQHVVAAHLSQKNNAPNLVIQAMTAALGEAISRFGIADQDNGCPWLEIC